MLRVFEFEFFQFNLTVIATQIHKMFHLKHVSSVLYSVEQFCKIYLNKSTTVYNF